MVGQAPDVPHSVQVKPKSKVKPTKGCISLLSTDLQALLEKCGDLPDFSEPPTNVRAPLQKCPHNLAPAHAPLCQARYQDLGNPSPAARAISRVPVPKVQNLIWGLRFPQCRGAGRSTHLVKVARIGLAHEECTAQAALRAAPTA